MAGNAPDMTAQDWETAQVDRANATTRTPVMFVHGLWLLPSSWDRWAALFEEAGYIAVTAGWPDDPQTADDANAHPEVFAGKAIGHVADHVGLAIGKLDRKPAVIGHSFGGLFTQVLAGRGLSAASVAIDPAPFRGVLPLPVSELRAAAPVLGNPANLHRAVPLSYEQFRCAFANAVSEQEAHDLYERFAVRARARRSSRPHRQPQPVDRGHGRRPQPRPRPAADHLRREGPHRPPGHRPRRLRQAAAQPRNHRVHRNPQPGPLTDHRPRLA